jgi:hypothetical protein
LTQSVIVKIAFGWNVTFTFWQFLIKRLEPFAQYVPARTIMLPPLATYPKAALKAKFALALE